MIQKLRAWTDESERAVSPVIGVILMVAITVILAAVIGSFVLGIGGDIEETPQVRLEATDASDPLNSSANDGNNVFNIKHNGGDSLSADDLSLVVETNGTSTDISGDLDTSDLSGDISVGSTLAFAEDGGAAADGVDPQTELNIRLVHQPSDSLLLDTTITVE